MVDESMKVNVNVSVDVNVNVMVKGILEVKTRTIIINTRMSPSDLATSFGGAECGLRV